MADDQKIYLSVKQAAKLCSISESNAYKLVAAGVWRSARIGRRILIHRDWLEQWAIEQLEKQAA